MTDYRRRHPMGPPPGSELLASLTDGRRFFELDLVYRHIVDGEGTHPLTERLRIAVVGRDPFNGHCDHIVVELQHQDANNDPSWREVSPGSHYHNVAVYCLLRRMIAIADRHKVLWHIGKVDITHHRGTGRLTFTPSEEQ